MATYKEKVGTAVVNYAGNYPGAVEGELWYDSTNKDFKYLYPNLSSAGSWRTGANLNDGRNAGGSAGTGDAALFFAGDPAGAGLTANTELYDGTSQTEVNDLNTARREVFTGLGLTNTAALCVGGSVPGPTTNTENWNGTNWTEVNNLNTARRESASSGTDNTSALVFGGETPDDTEVANKEDWNGVSWAETAD